MAIFHYKNSDVLDRVEVKSTPGGNIQATIIAAEKANPRKIEQLREQLGKHNISTLIDVVDGRLAIQVRGLKNRKVLFASLSEVGLGVSRAAKEITADDHKKKLSLTQWVRSKPLFLSAIFYDLGNISYIISGIIRARHNPDGRFTPKDISESMIGVAFFAGDLLMTGYGHTQGDEELKAVDIGLKRHLHRKGIQAPQGDDLNPDTLHQSGFFKAADRWLRKHIIRVKCLTEFIGGLLTIHAGLRRDADGSLTNSGKLAAGLLLSTGWASTFMLERPRGYDIFDEDTQADDTVVGAIKRNPRGTLAQTTGIANNLFNLGGSLNWMQNPKYRGEAARFRDDIRKAANPTELAYAMNRRFDFIPNVITACCFIIGHTLFGLSGAKRPNPTEDDNAMLKDLELLSANMLLKQPAAIREATIAETSEYISKLRHVRTSKEDIAAAIQEKMVSLDRSKTSQAAWTTRVQSTPSSGVQPAL